MTNRVGAAGAGKCRSLHYAQLRFAPVGMTIRRSLGFARGHARKTADPSTPLGISPTGSPPRLRSGSHPRNGSTCAVRACEVESSFGVERDERLKYRS